MSQKTSVSFLFKVTQDGQLKINVEYFGQHAGGIKNVHQTVRYVEF